VWPFAACIAVCGLAAARPVLAACVPGGADAEALAAARAAIDLACSCPLAASRRAHVRCARGAVAEQVAGGLLAPDCRREALRHARQSVCGKPGAVVCCRVHADGQSRHRIVPDAAACVPTATLSACVSPWSSIPAGCDRAGCVRQCGNGVVEPGEACDPPDLVECGDDCRRVSCAAPRSSCGNGVVDAGEGCEPPGVDACGRDCQPASCAAPPAGEVGIACADAAAGVAVASNGAEYLVAWNTQHRRIERELLVRTLDVNAMPVGGGARVITDEVSCFTAGTPAAASDGAGYHLVWPSFLSLSVPGTGIDSRLVLADGSVSVGQRLAFAVPVGQCQSGITGPTATAAMGEARYAALWLRYAGCFNGPIFYSPAGRIVDASSSGPFIQDIGYAFTPPPGIYGDGPAGIGRSGDDVLIVAHATAALNPSPPITTTFMLDGHWLAADGTTTAVSLGSRRAALGRAPAVSGGAASFLVAWGQTATATDTTITEIRALRVTRAAGPIDPDGGVLLAATGAVQSGPVAAFDGSVWLVVWLEASATGNDLRAVAVRTDGSVVDAMPRLLATNATRGPAVASAGDGRVLVAYVRADGTASAIRAVLVPGTE
jgi:hypothetical protein